MSDPDRSARRTATERKQRRRQRTGGRSPATLLELTGVVELNKRSPIDAIQGGTECI